MPATTNRGSGGSERSRTLKSMRAFSIERLRQEDGIALVLALGITSVLIIFVASMIDYTTSNSRAARLTITK
jgi:hypothetical protein